MILSKYLVTNQLSRCFDLSKGRVGSFTNRFGSGNFHKQAMTLVEVMVGMGVLSIGVLGLSGMFFFNSSSATISQRQGIANMIALGVLENLVTKTPAELASGSISVQLFDGSIVSFQDGVPVTTYFDVKNTPGNPNDDIDMVMTLTMDSRLGTATPHVRGTLEYNWPKTFKDTSSRASNSLLLIRSRLTSQ